MKLTCDRVREVLWPLDRPRSHLPEEEAARTHLAACDDCRAFFLRDAKLAGMLRRIGDGLAVPASNRLRAAVAEALAGSRADELTPPAEATADAPTVVPLPPARGKRWKMTGLRAEIAAAAAAVVLLGGGLLLADRYQGSGDPDRFAADYVRTAVVQVERPGLDPEAVKGFYEEAMGRPIVPVALDDAPVTRATVCDLAGDLGSMIEYDLAGIRLVHYRIPVEGESSDTRPRDVAVDARRGVQVAHWADTEFENALVSDAPADYLRWLAESRFRGPVEVTNYGSPASRSWRQVSN